MQRFIDAGLVGAEGASALQDEYDPGRRAMGHGVMGHGGTSDGIHAGISSMDCRRDEATGAVRSRPPNAVASSSAQPMPATQAGQPKRSKVWPRRTLPASPPVK